MGARCLRPGSTGRWRGARGRTIGIDCRYEPVPDLRACLACGDLIHAHTNHPALGAVNARLCTDCRTAAR